MARSWYKDSRVVISIWRKPSAPRLLAKGKQSTVWLARVGRKPPNKQTNKQSVTSFCWLLDINCLHSFIILAKLESLPGQNTKTHVTLVSRMSSFPLALAVLGVQIPTSARVHDRPGPLECCLTQVHLSLVAVHLPRKSCEAHLNFFGADQAATSQVENLSFR